jgi:hypothetical protein
MDETQIRYVMKKPKNPTALYDVTSSTAGTVVVMSQFEYDQTYTNFNTGPTTSGVSSNEGVNDAEICIRQTFTFSGQGSLAFTQTVPSYARVTQAWVTYDTAIVLVTATNLGIGTNGSGTLPGAILLSGSAVTKNTQYNAWPSAGGVGTDNSTASTAQTLWLTSTNSSGNAAGTVTSGTIRAYLFLKRVDPPFKHP